MVRTSHNARKSTGGTAPRKANIVLRHATAGAPIATSGTVAFEPTVPGGNEVATPPFFKHYIFINLYSNFVMFAPMEGTSFAAIVVLG
jgi:hypothetical protein